MVPLDGQRQGSLRGVQRRAVKMVSGLLATTYQGRLAELGFLSLETRRIKYDLVQTFKIIHGHDRVDRRHWFTLVGSNPTRVTRVTSDPLNIVRKDSNLDLRRQFSRCELLSTGTTLMPSLKVPSRYLHSRINCSLFKNT